MVCCLSLDMALTLYPTSYHPRRENPSSPSPSKDKPQGLLLFFPFCWLWLIWRPGLSPSVPPPCDLPHLEVFTRVQCRVKGQRAYFAGGHLKPEQASPSGPASRLPHSTVHSLGASCPSPGHVVSGTPKPEVTWLLEGAPVRRREGVVEVYEEGGCHYLCLLRARARDGGSYSCTASNVRGQVSCSWTLLVKREYAPPVRLGSLWGPSMGRLLPPCRVYIPTHMPRPESLSGANDS